MAATISNLQKVYKINAGSSHDKSTQDVFNLLIYELNIY